MAGSDITLKDVMKELKIIKKLVLRDLQIDIEDVKVDKRKLTVNKRSLEDAKKIFDDFREWADSVWEECPNKKKISAKSEFLYRCKILKKECKFEVCPLNIKRQDII
jgi:hypothetical protein